MQANLDLFSDLGADEADVAPQDTPQANAVSMTSTQSPSTAFECRNSLARRLYSEIQTSKPEWDQLGLGTQSVWLERADRTIAGDPRPWAIRC